MEDFIIIPYLINLVLLAMIQYHQKDLIPSVFRSAISYNVAVKLIRESKNIKTAGSFFLNFIFFVSASIFIAQLLVRYLPEAKDAKLMVLAFYAFIPLFLILILNKTANYLSGKVFRLDDMRKEYNRSINFYNQVLGLILFPVTVMISYSGFSQFAIYVGIIASILCYLLRIARLMKINFVKQIDIFYMFLYLCTLEIVPVLYIIKTLTIL